MFFHVFCQERSHLFVFFINGVCKLYIFSSSFLTSNNLKHYSHNYFIIKKRLLIHSFIHSFINIRAYYMQASEPQNSGCFLCPFFFPPLHNKRVFQVVSHWNLTGLSVSTFLLPQRFIPNVMIFCSSLCSFL